MVKSLWYGVAVVISLVLTTFVLCNSEPVNDNVQHPKHRPQSPDPPQNGETATTDDNLEIAVDKQDLPKDSVKPDQSGDTISDVKETTIGAIEEKLNEPVDSEQKPELTVPSVKLTISDESVKSSDDIKSAPVSQTDDKDLDVPLNGEDEKPTADDASEEIPSFKEFREQKEKETETQKVVNVEPSDDAVVEKPKGKLIQKNYADTSCGAKIVDNKKDFKNSGSILNNNKDLYAMITCEGSIWFVVELCDTIQIHAIQLANYELFSSSIKEFKIYSAETYPPKEWTHIGTYETSNKREIQQFVVENKGLYSKFIRFEKISFHGKEHFCVLSTFQVLGMSMVDEYEEQHLDQPEVDPYEIPIDESDDLLDGENADKSLIQGAKDTVKNIVDSALNVLGVNKNEIDQEKNITEPEVEAVSENLPKEEPETKPEPTEESVIVKVDEAGEEIRKDEETDKRLKGEVDSLSVPEIPKPKVESIMEGVDLAKEENVEVKEDIPVTKPKEVKSDPVPEQKFEKLDVPETPEKKTDQSEKGVVMSNSPKKNSIFVELDKKIKELQKNLSLSNDYLETLSSRYKKVDSLFKPLEKTLSAVDLSMVDFKERLTRLEGKFDKFEVALETFVQHMNEMHSKSNALITSTNLILFILILLLYLFWRLSYKVNQISYCVLDKPQETKASYISENVDTRGREAQQPPRKRQKSKQVKSRDSSPVHHKLERIKSEPHLAKKENNNVGKKMSYNPPIYEKKPLQSVQMDLIYPQPTSPTLKRRSKNLKIKFER